MSEQANIASRQQSELQSLMRQEYSLRLIVPLPLCPEGFPVLQPKTGDQS